MRQKGRFTSEHNARIIRLIRAKMNPLHPTSKRSLYNTFTRTFHHSPPQIPASPPQPSPPLLNSTLTRAKQWLKENTFQTPKELMKSNLGQFIEIFMTPLRERDSSNLRAVNEVEVNQFDCENVEGRIRKDSQRDMLGSEERSLLNAKIRCRLNHRKIIHLQRKHGG